MPAERPGLLLERPSLSRSLPLDREYLVQWYRSLRRRSCQLFDLVDPDLYYTKPISLRNPIVFYEGHLPGFAVNALIKKGLGRPGVDARLEEIFARGIDPDSVDTARARHGDGWPSRDEVRAFVAAAEALIEDALRNAPLDQPGRPILDRAEGAFAILEHEAMHQETLLYMWHRIPLHLKRRPDGYAPVVAGTGATQGRVEIPGGTVRLGADRDSLPFGWDNEFEACDVPVASFVVQRHNVCNREYLAFVEAGGYQDPRWWSAEDWAWITEAAVTHPLFWEREDGAWFWRGQFDRLPLPGDWPVYVSLAEARAFARWQGGRLMTEAEYHRAAFAEPGSSRERAFPWGDGSPAAAHGTFDFASWDPRPVGSSPAGRSAWGVEDLVGNGWEWTASPFLPFPGFAPMPSYPEYSAEFFDGQHFVLKGASPVTDRELVRRTLRNWFRPTYPFVYAAFRCAWDA